MIVKAETDHYVSHPKKPSWYPDSLEGVGPTFVLTLIIGVATLLVGMLFAIVCDAAFLNGPGFGEDEATGAQIAWLVGSMVAAAMAGTVTYCELLPRIGFKRVYFSTRQHQRVYQELHSLPPEAQTHAQDAYEAVASFKYQPDSYSHYSDDGHNPEWTIFNRALQVWDETYTALRKTYQDDTDLQLHKDRLQNAEETLKTLGGSS